jgi:hypothetical protein
MNKEEERDEYPRFISNKPCGDDKYEGKSQERLAKAIAKHFKTIDNRSAEDKICLSRIVGVEGKWGSGKSNVIGLLEKELDEEYYFFTYDAWGHQEDLQRRSFLELLTTELVKNNFLTGKTLLNVRGLDQKEVSWQEKQKYLLARRKETDKTKIPRINKGILVAFFVSVLTPVFTFIAYALKPDEASVWDSILAIAIAALPVIVSLTLWGFSRRRNKQKYNLDYLLAIYENKIESDICYETISEAEPSVSEFKAWMQDISDYIGDAKHKCKKKKLVIVYDNMDRLPAQKVKELWSSIHTFFSEDGFDNIWTIIPFDEKHLACAFSGENEDDIPKTTRYFINKTFPIVYRVPQPVITDFRKIFNAFFEEAFGQDSPEKDTINRIFRLLQPEANVREIISFINELVALRNVWGEEITLLNSALFTLKKDEILKDSVTAILSGSYLTEVNKIVENDIEMQRQISALAYGVEKEHASQIPLTKHIESCIEKESEDGINQYAKSNKQFLTVLDEVVRNEDDTKVDKIINCLYGLKAFSDSNLLNKIWEHLANQKLKSKFKPVNENNPNQPDFDDAYQHLLLKVNQGLQSKLVEHFYSSLGVALPYNGGAYFKALKKLDDFIENATLTISIPIQEESVPPQFFFKYVQEAQEEYTKYKLKTNAEKLNRMVLEMVPDKLDCAKEISLLKASGVYSFPGVYNKIETLIQEDEIDEKNFANIFAVYKVLTEEKPLPQKITNQSRIEQISNALKKADFSKGSADILAMGFSKGMGLYLSDVDVSDELIAEIAENIEYYENYGTLLKNGLSWNITFLNRVLRYMIQHDLGEELDLTEVLPEFDTIVERFNVTEEELLNHLSKYPISKDEITEANITNIITSPHFLSCLAKVENPLTSHLNDTIVKALSEVRCMDLFNNRNEIYYWPIMIKAFIDTPYMEVLPENMISLGKELLKEMAKGSSLSDLDKKIINKLDKKDTAATILEIRTEFCNKIYTMNSEKFEFYHPWFKEQGKLEERAGDAVNFIIKPVIRDKECLGLILSEKDYYADLINKGGDYSTDLRKEVKELLDSNSDSKLLAFAKVINAYNEEDEQS